MENVLQHEYFMGYVEKDGKIGESVTVIIPAYNCEKYIERSINSVMRQTILPHRIIVVNDGSTDGTLNVCNYCGRVNDIVQVFSKENGGLSTARNYGLNYVKTEYVAFLDADDEYLPDFIEKMLMTEISFGADITVCGYYSKYVDGKLMPSELNQDYLCLDRNAAERALLIGKYLSSHAWNKLYKTKLFDHVKYPEGKNYEDIYTFPQLLDQCKKIAFVPENLILYYQISSSITHMPSIKNECNAFEATLRRFNKYRKIHTDLISDAAREVLEIAIRLVLRKKGEEDMIAYNEIQEELEDFLRYACTNRFMSKKLSMKYRIALMLYPFFRGKF